MSEAKKTYNEVVNTAEEVKQEPMIGLFHALPGGIEASEARGQTQLVNSEVLPIDMPPSAKKTLTEAGVKFGDPVEGDTLFIHAVLPEGWKKVAAKDHSMWSELLDEKGRKRASIFYKAAFYDRRANLNVSSRYSITREYPDPNQDEASKHLVKDGDTVLFETPLYTMTEADYEAYRNPGQSAATAWLTERFPDWKDPSKYWND